MYFELGSGFVVAGEVFDRLRRAVGS